MPRTHAAALLAAAALVPAPLALGGFSYSFLFGFPSEMTSAGDTTTSNLLRLTTGGGQASSAHAVDPQVVSTGFTTSFRFRIEDGPLAIDGDGFAFVLHNDSDGALALGMGGSGLGYDGIERCVAIEFDTFGFSGEAGTPHVSVQASGLGPITSNDSASLDLYLLSESSVDVLDGQGHVARINYVPGVAPEDSLLTVYIDEELILSVPIDLTAFGPVGSEVDLTDEDGAMFVGFTAGTGLADSIHVIEDWSFDDQSGACASPYAYLGWSGHGGFGSTLSMGARLGGSGPLVYAWYKDSVELTDDDKYSGTRTHELFVADLAASDEGLYELIVTNGCGSTTLPFPIDLTPACNAADITDIGDSGAGPDGQLTLDDILAYINAYNDAEGCPGAAPCNQADITDIGDNGTGPDGQLTLDDILAYINAYNEGC